MSEIFLARTVLTIPAIQISPRHAHRLLGAISRAFPDLEMLHQHDDTQPGGYAYRYPLVQYKVLTPTLDAPAAAAAKQPHEPHGMPYIVGFGDEGRRAVEEVFMRLDGLTLLDREWPVESAQIEHQTVRLGDAPQPIIYHWRTVGLLLNARNYETFRAATSDAERFALLDRAAVNQVLSVAKRLDLRFENRLMARGHWRIVPVNFKNVEQIGVEGHFAINADLPDLLGIGRSPVRGFGTIARRKE